MAKQYSFLDKVFRIGMRILQPDSARQMELDDVFQIDPAAARGGNDVDYLKVIDNGADITIFSFSGLDALHAGLARFEFQRVLSSLGKEANLVFVRDIHRLCFQLKPDGTEGGAEFYESEVRRVMKELGASHNIAMGSSLGGSAAFYMGTKAEMDQIIVFGAAFEPDAFTNPGVLFKTFFDIRRLVLEPMAYIELIIVLLSAIWGMRLLEKKFGLENLQKPLVAYEEAEHKPIISLFYGKNAPADSRQAQMIAHYDTVKLHPLPTGRHNTPAFLKHRGELSSAIAQEILLPIESKA